MDAHMTEAIKEIGGEAVSFDVPMSNYTTLRAGGCAEAVYRAGDLEGLKRMIAFLTEEKIPYLVMGKGSNLLVRDGGLNGVAIVLDGSLAAIEDSSETGPSVRAGAGLSLRRLVDFCTEKGLSGVEFMAGIPGTLGGAVAMNAGSWGREISEVIGVITVLTMKGKLEVRDRQELVFRYRELDLAAGDIVVNATLNLGFDRPAAIKKRVASNLKQRKEKFPLDMASAGSVFKNPEGDHAGRLIDAAGLKETVIGGAMISPKHANFIINTGTSSASDIVALMDLAAARVRERFNIELVPELKVVGEK
jgi:UDP-N-acetylmuramate dehydrogenase